ncbi:MAG: serpin family protein, partial [Candidatus Aminicenantales bacterium]
MMINSLGGKVFILVVAICISPLLSKSQEQADQARLAAVLKKSAEYCRRLDKAALDFVCLEEVTEFSRYYTPHTDVYLYDYQFIRRNEETKERRNLLAFNGKKAREALARLAALSTLCFFGLAPQPFATKADMKPAGEPVKGEEAVVSYSAFGIDLYLKTAAADPGGNVFISPASVGLALAMAWTGSAGETQAAMAA